MTIIQWQVCISDWSLDAKHYTKPIPDTGKIDHRTVRAKTFDTEREAIKYAEKYLKDREDIEWLASLEVKKCTTEIIKKLK